VPLAASLVVALLAAVVAAVALGLREPERPAPVSAPAATQPGAPDLSRFDRGGRAAVVVRRVEEGR